VLEGITEEAMAKLEALEGISILALAVAMLAAFTLRMMVPNADILRAATAPALVSVHPGIVVSTAAR
jgi:hypothetical protein